MKLIFEKISRNVDRDGFDCGVPSLNEYLKRYALQNLRKNVGVTIVATSDEDRKRVLGYYSVSMAQVEFDQMPEDLAKGLPRYPVPRCGWGDSRSTCRREGWESVRRSCTMHCCGLSAFHGKSGPA